MPLGPPSHRRHIKALRLPGRSSIRAAIQPIRRKGIGRGHNRLGILGINGDRAIILALIWRDLRPLILPIAPHAPLGIRLRGKGADIQRAILGDRPLLRILASIGATSQQRPTRAPIRAAIHATAHHPNV